LDKEDSMDTKELITRERIALRGLKAALISQIELEVGRTIERLDDLEIRLEKENLTGGEPTFKITDGSAGLEKGIIGKDPQVDAPVVNAVDIIPGPNGKTAK
jgi:hypothetical protein